MVDVWERGGERESMEITRGGERERMLEMGRGRVLRCHNEGEGEGERERDMSDMGGEGGSGEGGRDN